MAENTKEALVELLLKLNTDLSVNVKEYVDGKDSAIQTDVNTLVDNLASLTSRVNLIDIIDTEDGVETLIERVTALNDAFASNEDIDSILTNIGNLTTGLENVVGRLDTVEGAVESNTNSISSLLSRAAALETISSANASKIGALEATVAANETAASEKYLSKDDIEDVKLNRMCEISNASRSVFGLTPTECDGDSDASAL